MNHTSVADRRIAPSRALLDLAEGRLDESEIDALTEWLTPAVSLTLPEGLIERGLRARRGLYAAVAF